MPPTPGSCGAGRRRCGRAGAARRPGHRAGRPSGSPAIPAPPPAPPPAMRMSPPHLDRGPPRSPPSAAPAQAARRPRLPRPRSARVATCATPSQVRMGMKGLGMGWRGPPFLSSLLRVLQNPPAAPEPPSPLLHLPPRSLSRVLHHPLQPLPLHLSPAFACPCRLGGASMPAGCIPARCLLGCIPFASLFHACWDASLLRACWGAFPLHPCSMPAGTPSGH